MTVLPDKSQQENINDLIVGLKDEGIWDKLGFMHVFAQHSRQAACLNWKGDALNCAEVNSPIFLQNQGYKGSIDAYLIVSDSMAWSEIPGFSTTDSAFHTSEFENVNAQQVPLGYLTRAVTGSNIGAYTNYNGALLGWLNSITQVSGQVTSSEGVSSIVRVGNTITNYRNGISIGSGSNQGTADASTFTGVTYLKHRNLHSTRAVSFGAAGAGLNATEIATLHGAISAYMTSIGIV